MIFKSILHCAFIRLNQTDRTDVYLIFTLVFISQAIETTFAKTLTVYTSRDNTLFQTTDENLSNGAGPHVFSGSTISFGLRRALLYFDLSKIPIGSEIISAKLTLFMDRTAVGSYPIALHRLLDDWGESDSIGARGGGLGGPAQKGDATWLHRYFPDEMWKNPGGDFLQEPSAVTDVDSEGSYEWSSNDIIEDIKIWTSNSVSNAGWILIGEEKSDGITTKRFISKDSNSLERRPSLQIVYDFPTAIESKSWGKIKRP